MEELLESLELEKSSYHMGLSKVRPVRQPSRGSAARSLTCTSLWGACSTTEFRAGAALCSGQRFNKNQNIFLPVGVKSSGLLSRLQRQEVQRDEGWHILLVKEL